MIATKRGIQRNFGLLVLKSIRTSHSKNENKTKGSLVASIENQHRHQQNPAPASASASAPAPAPAPARYNGPKYPSEMNQKQKGIYNSILKSRPNTGISGPFGPWLSVEAIAEPASQLGKVLRYDTSLSFRESELIILLTASKMKSNTEFQIHRGEALKAGIGMDLIATIRRPLDEIDLSLETIKKHVIELLDNDREKAIVAFTSELLDTSTVSDETYESTKACCDNKDSVLVFLLFTLFCLCTAASSLRYWFLISVKIFL